MDIAQILKDHQEWLDNNGQKGTRANLRRANLSEANFYGANLRRANFYGANLRRANLSGANFYGANLSEADLSEADLSEADLYGVNLSEADLYGVNLYRAKGILQWQAPQGEKRICYSVINGYKVMHKLGCFYGETTEAIEAIRQKYGVDSMYERLLQLNADALLEEAKKSKN